MAQSKKRKDKGAGSVRMLPVLHPNAAGIDIGAEEVFVAVSADRAAEPVRSFETFTRNLHEMADWLQACGVKSVAMESTGVFWIPVFQILEKRVHRHPRSLEYRSAAHDFRINVNRQGSDFFFFDN